MTDIPATIHSSSPRTAVIVVLAVLAVLAVALVGGTLVARKRGYSGIGGNTIVRCKKGHLFTTIWVPGVSLKAIRLGTARYQHCPVGKHWSLVRPVKETLLSDEEKQVASQHHDVRIP